MVNLLLRDSMIHKILHILCQSQLPVRILGLSAICVHHHMLISHCFDDLQIIRQVALIFASSHILCIAAFQNYIIILHQTYLILHAHVHNPPLWMCDHDFLYSGISCRLDYHKGFFR